MSAPCSLGRANVLEGSFAVLLIVLCVKGVGVDIGGGGLFCTGVVDQVLLTTNESGQTFVKVRVPGPSASHR